MNKIEKEMCPFCKTKNLTLTEEEKIIPSFGKVYVLTMKCSNCDCDKKDIMFEEEQKPCKLTFEIKSEKDLKVKVIYSAEATIKLPQLRLNIPANSGCICTIGDILNQFGKNLEEERDAAEDQSEKKSVKNHLKKLRKIKFGDISTKLVIEDPSGNSVILK